MRSPFRRAALVAVIAFAGCGDNLAAGPDLEVTSPERGLIADATAVVVEGRASGGITGLFGVSVNGVRAEVDGDGRFSVALELGPGLHRIETIAVSVGGGLTRDVRAVSLGPRSGAASIEQGVILSVGTVGLGRVARDTLLPAIDMSPVYAAVQASPIADVGAGCTRDVISVSSIDAPIAQVFLYGLLDGLGGEILFSPIDTSLSADYADSGCSPATGAFDFDTLELHLTFELELGLTDGALDVALSNEFRLYDHELVTTNVDVEDAVVDRVTADIELHMADALVPAGIDAYTETFTGWVDGFARTRSAPVGGGSVEAVTELAAVSSGAGGISLSFDLAGAGVAGGAWIPTPADPIVPVSPRAAIAVADDAVDQILGGVWAAGGFATALDGGGELELLVPPVVSGADVAIGDWILEAGDVELALFGTVPLEAAGEGTDVSLIAGEPVLESQLLAGELDPEERAALVAAASALLAERLDAALAALSVEIAEAVAPSLGVTAEGGYLVIDTFIPPS